MARKKIQKNFNIPPEIAKWFDSIERQTGATRGRIGVAAALAYMQLSRQGQKLCMVAATALDRGEFTLDEVLAFMPVVRPQMFHVFSPLAAAVLYPDVSDEEWKKFARGEGEMPGRDLNWQEQQNVIGFDEHAEKEFARERWEGAKARWEAAREEKFKKMKELEAKKKATKRGQRKQAEGKRSRT